MNTKQDLIAGLEQAHNLMQRMVALQSKRANIRSQYTPLIAMKNPFTLKKEGRKIWGWVIQIGLWLFAGYFIYELVSSMARYMLGVFLPQLNFIFAIGCIPLYSFLRNRLVIFQNKKISIKNAEITEQNRNSPLYEAEIEVIQQIKNIHAQYAREILTWYPNNYCSIDAVKFFIDAVRNFRADNIKEAINLYEDALHKGRMEYAQQQMLDNQAAMIELQQLGNMLAVGNMVMQAGTQNAINKNTQAIHEENKKNREFLAGLGK